MTLPVRVVLSGLALVLAAFVVELAAGIMPAGASEPFQKFASNGVFIGAALVCGWRAVAIAEQRLAWMLFALGLLSWGLGDLYFTLALWDLADIPVPSPADAGYLGLYPLVFAGLMLLGRGRVAAAGRGAWVDALIVALAVAAFSATLLFDAIVTSTGGPPASVATNLAYPLADLLLVALAAGGLAMSGWRLSTAWGWIAAALAAFALTDAVYLYETATSSYAAGHVVDAGWPLAALMIARAAWLPAERERAARPPRLRTIVLPITLALVCLGMLTYDHFARVNVLAVCLASAAMLALLARLGMSVADNVRMLAASRAEARTDALTGLGNRRALTDDLAQALAGPAPAPVVLGVYDLDGFKLYNDSFGHGAGDALLARLGVAMRAAVGAGGRAYRMGGDEFCILYDAGGDVDEASGIVREAAFALTERGDAFAVGCSFGSILLPREATTAESALSIADARMYLHKGSGRASAGTQIKNVLHQALNERHPDLEQQITGVAALADAVARRIGLDAGQVEEVRLAAELHDVGKVAIPDAILAKPAPLDGAEWEFMRRHTIIGERIIAAAPALAGVAKIVRSSHERVDGAGYPDGLCGAEIPQGARIVFACNAYHAMVSGRPYARALTVAEAIEELRRCSNSQFDGLVVEALCGVLQERALAVAPATATRRVATAVSPRESAAPPPA
jgi:two-component system cell cycle response regulator